MYQHLTKELDALIKRLRSSSRGEKTDYSVKIHKLHKQLAMDKEEEQKLQDDRDNFLRLALDGYQRSLVVSGKYDLRVVFRLVSLWFNLSSCKHVVESMQKTVKEVQSYFLPLVYQIASRLGSLKDAQGSNNFQNALVSLLRKMAIDHPYHTMFQLLALANGDRVKDRQRSRRSFVVDIEKKQAAENLLNELGSFHGPLIRQMKMMVEAYIKLAELETSKEVPVMRATIPVDPSCQYGEGSFPHLKGFGDSIMIMNGINAPKQVECLGSDGEKYRQLAKSGNDDLRQDASRLLLSLSFLGADEQHGNSAYEQLESEQQVLFSCLRRVVIEVDLGSDFLIALAKFILNNAPLLEELIIWGQHGRSWNTSWSSELKGLSITAKIIFKQV